MYLPGYSIKHKLHTWLVREQAKLEMGAHEKELMKKLHTWLVREQAKLEMGAHEKELYPK